MWLVVDDRGVVRPGLPAGFAAIATHHARAALRDRWPTAGRVESPPGEGAVGTYEPSPRQTTAGARLLD